ncbi:hypothetical protein ABVB72_25530 [Rhizobium nepotum]|uniref:hypothetical protein n=1 Tax=Rhizobium nepotum TaxID=1035271 RepID=UPI00336A1F50
MADKLHPARPFGQTRVLVFRSALQTRLQGKKVAELAVAPEAGNIHAKPPFLIRVEPLDN